MRDTVLIVLAVLALTVLPAVSMAAEPETTLSKEQAATLLNEATDLFRKANTLPADEADELYGKAAVLYEQIINDGHIANPGLYYDLGNCYLMTDDIGRAILNYRRAEMLNGSDPQIHKNLAYARSKRVDQVEERVEKRVLSRLLFWHYDFNLSTRFMVSLVLFALLMTLAGIRILTSRIGGIIPTMIIVGVVFVCFAGSTAADIFGIGHTQSGVILAKSVVARQGNGENYPESFSEPLHAGTEFEVLEERVHWAHIRLHNGDDAWIPLSSFELVGM